MKKIYTVKKKKIKKIIKSKQNKQPKKKLKKIASVNHALIITFIIIIVCKLKLEDWCHVNDICIQIILLYNCSVQESGESSPTLADDKEKEYIEKEVPDTSQPSTIVLVHLSQSSMTLGPLMAPPAG